MNNSIRWAVLIGALLLAWAVGFWAYQAGMAHGIEQHGTARGKRPACNQ